MFGPRFGGGFLLLNESPTRAGARAGPARCAGGGNPPTMSSGTHTLTFPVRIRILSGHPVGDIFAGPNQTYQPTGYSICCYARGTLSAAALMMLQ
jgi:hypothetical protein